MFILRSSLPSFAVLTFTRLHMFYGQRCIDVPDGLPKWTGLNKESDLIEDSPPEQIRENVRQREKEREERFKNGENK
jgi:hypothetical protein